MSHFCLCCLGESSYLQSLNCLQYFWSVLPFHPSFGYSLSQRGHSIGRWIHEATGHKAMLNLSFIVEPWEFLAFKILICVILLGKRRFQHSRFILTGLKWIFKRTTLVLAITSSRVEPHGTPGFSFFFFFFLAFVAWSDLIFLLL